MMCGFSALCEDMEEVLYRLKLIPTQRAELESSACYLIDLDSGEKWDIRVGAHGWEIVGL